MEKTKPGNMTVGCVVSSEKGPKESVRRLKTEAEIRAIYDRVSNPNDLLYHVAHARN